MQARFLYFQAVYQRGGDMDTRHQKDAMSTDHKTRTDDEHIHELDKRQLKQSEKDEKDVDLIPKPGGKAPAGKKE
jgi:hypothetical protein